MKKVAINSAYLEVLTPREADVILAARKVADRIRRRSKWTPKCVRELIAAVDAMPNGYFCEETK